MFTYAKRAAFVIVALLAFTIYAIGRRGGMIDPEHVGPMMVGFVAADALHRLAVFLATSAVVCIFSLWRHREQSGERQSPAPRR
jgi:hypothetical protein